MVSKGILLLIGVILVTVFAGRFCECLLNKVRNGVRKEPAESN
jgi:hypothetical protein